MAEIANLRLARKARARSQAARDADAARAKAGRSKAERKVSAMDRARAERLLDGARLENED